MTGKDARKPPAGPAQETAPDREPAPMPIDRAMALATLRRGRQAAFDVQPTAPERDAIAAFLGLLELREMRFRGRIDADADGWRLTGRLTADLDQACVATLDPVPARIDVEIARSFVPAGEEPTAIDLDAEDEDDPDPVTDRIDPAHVAIEELALALPPYPRAEGLSPVDTLAGPPGTEPLDDDAVKPFAGLAALKAKLEGGGAS